LPAARDPQLQEGLAACIAAAAADESAWDGLFAVGDERPVAALWVQRTAGNTAVVWPPPSNDPCTDALFAAAAEFVDEQRIGVAQMIVSAADGFTPEAMDRRGFALLAELSYLLADVAIHPAQKSQLSQSLQFVPHAGSDMARLARVVEQTYQGTRDCPRLDNVRDIDDVLVGYREQGVYRPEHWYLVADEGHNIGVLLLAEHPSVRNWELVYMGVVPEVRGRRLGETIARFACETAQRGGAQRLVLAVDAANAPAREMYCRTGFVEWDRRTIYARLSRSGASHSMPS
jgi:ribosomal protein S18 acetylase RimI-like enzyme